VTAYYNEIDPVACEVLQVLIQNDVIAPGDIDTRSIKDVKPHDLRDYTQVHLFAGGGLWSVAARLAGWPDDKPLWTGSCPCQPFSQAGQGRGVADERHLWPDFHRLIAARRPAVVVGEQVAGKAGYGWLDGVRADLGKEGYASGAVDIPAASVDAPHIRQRLYWAGVLSDTGHLDGRTRPIDEADRQEPANGYVLHADANSGGRAGWQEDTQRGAEQRAAAEWDHEQGVTQGDAFDTRLERQPRHGDGEAGWAQPHRSIAEADGGADLAHATRGRSDGHGASGEPNWQETRGRRSWDGHGKNGSAWSDHEWLICHDGKARRTKPGLRLLVDGMPGRVGLWRIAGNAIVAPLAAEVLKALLDVV
jgi:DNA (cytosine-5)-methyltransferase 1